jgi:putative transposase
MALSKSALSDLLDALRAGGDLDVIREGLALVLQALIEAEATQQIGADRYERSTSRTTHRNGTRNLSTFLRRQAELFTEWSAVSSRAG